MEQRPIMEMRMENYPGAGRHNVHWTLLSSLEGCHDSGGVCSLNSQLIWIMLVAVVCMLFSSCDFLDSRLIKVVPVVVANHTGGKTIVYFKDTNHDELILSTTGKRSDLWDTNANIAIFYKPIYYKMTGDTLHIMCERPDCFHPEFSDAHIMYHFREGNPLCYEKQAKANGYKIVHGLWNNDGYNQ